MLAAIVRSGIAMARFTNLVVACVALRLLSGDAGAAEAIVATPPRAVGDIDADGRRDCAVVIRRPRPAGLAEVFLAVFGETSGRWRLRATIRLDDGAAVDRLRLVPGRLTAAYRRHYPVDPPGQPSNRVLRSWAFVGDGLHGGDEVAASGRWVRAAAPMLPR